MNSTDMQMEQFLAELEQRLRETPGIEDALEGLLFFLGFFISIIAVVAVIGVIAWILQRFAYWKIFVKAGEKGWKSLIPFYDTYTVFKIVWKPLMYWISLAVGVVSILCSFIGGDIAQILSSVCSLVTIVLGIKLCSRLSKSFGHGNWFAAGLIFFSTIFLLIIALGKSQYTKPVVEEKAKAIEE